MLEHISPCNRHLTNYPEYFLRQSHSLAHTQKVFYLPLFNHQILEIPADLGIDLEKPAPSLWQLVISGLLLEVYVPAVFLKAQS